MFKKHLTRRSFVATIVSGLAGMSLSACMPVYDALPKLNLGSWSADKETSYSYPGIYAARSDGGFSLPAIPWQKIDSRFLRRVVDNPTGEAPGTIVIDTAQHYLYLVQPDGKAIRYGVGIGRAGFSWSGRAVVQYKKPWPRWFPPAEMIGRKPELKRYSSANGGMSPGIMNPLGARALYIYQDGKDTLYRIHGNPEWWSIGKSVSSGCIRLLNQDIIDLYNRVPDGTPIVVR